MPLTLTPIATTNAALPCSESLPCSSTLACRDAGLVMPASATPVTLPLTPVVPV